MNDLEVSDSTILECERQMMTATEEIAFRITDTIVCLGIHDPLLDTISRLCKELKVHLFVADSTTDVIAVPSFLVVINPDGISQSELAELGSWMCEMDDPSMKILLTRNSKTSSIPSRNRIREPSELNDEFLKFLILRTR